LKKIRKQPSNLGCNVVKAKVVSKDMGMGENGAKAQVAREYSLARLKAKL
jgi:hypothetical protein